MAEKTLKDAFYETLKDVYYAERAGLRSLKKAVKAAQSEKLKAALAKHSGQHLTSPTTPRTAARQSYHAALGRLIRCGAQRHCRAPCVHCIAPHRTGRPHA